MRFEYRKVRVTHLHSPLVRVGEICDIPRPQGSQGVHVVQAWSAIANSSPPNPTELPMPLCPMGANRHATGDRNRKTKGQCRGDSEAKEAWQVHR